MSPVHQSSNHRLDTGASISQDLFQALRQCALRGRRRTLDYEGTYLWRLCQSQDDEPAQSLGGALSGRVCVRVYIRVTVCAYL